jgi:hypothetical protein
MNNVIARTKSRELIDVGNNMGVVRNIGETETTPPMFIPSILKADDWIMVAQKAGTSESVRLSWKKRRLHAQSKLHQAVMGAMGLPGRYTRARIRQVSQEVRDAANHETQAAHAERLARLKEKYGV